MRARVAQLPNNSFKPITNTAWIRARLCKLQKGWTRLAAASDKVYQLLAHGRWFSPGTPASSTTKTGRHDIAEIKCKKRLLRYSVLKAPNIKLISRRLNILCLMFRIIAFCIMMLFACIYHRVGSWFTCLNHLHENIISLRVGVWDNKTSLTPPLLLKCLY
jgi:hypothetical protein